MFSGRFGGAPRRKTGLVEARQGRNELQLLVMLELTEEVIFINVSQTNLAQTNIECFRLLLH